MLQVFRHLLPWPVDAGVPSMQRVALEAVIEAPGFPGGALRVVTTHLEYYSALQRTAQIEALRDIALRVTGMRWRRVRPPKPIRPSPCCRAAKAACSAATSTARPVRRSMQRYALPGDAPVLKNAWPLAHGAVPPAPTFGVHDRRYFAEPACYDFFYVSANIEGLVRDVIVDGATTASDHQPVLLVLSS